MFLPKQDSADSSKNSSVSNLVDTEGLVRGLEVISENSSVSNLVFPYNPPPVDPLKMKKPLTTDLVLSPFNKKEQAQIPQLLDKASLAIHCWIKDGYEKAGNQFN